MKTPYTWIARIYVTTLVMVAALLSPLISPLCSAAGSDQGSGVPRAVLDLAATLLRADMEVLACRGEMPTGLLFPLADRWAQVSGLMETIDSSSHIDSRAPSLAVERLPSSPDRARCGREFSAHRALGEMLEERRGAPERLRNPGALWLLSRGAGEVVWSFTPVSAVGNSWVGEETVVGIAIDGPGSPSVGWIADDVGRIRAVASTVPGAPPGRMLAASLAALEGAASALDESSRGIKEDGGSSIDAAAAKALSQCLLARAFESGDGWTADRLADLAMNPGVPMVWRVRLAGHAEVLAVQQSASALRSLAAALRAAGLGAEVLPLAAGLEAMARQDMHAASGLLGQAVDSPVWAWPTRALVCADPDLATSAVGAALLRTEFPSTTCPPALLPAIARYLEGADRWAEFAVQHARYAVIWDEEPDRALSFAHALYRLGRFDECARVAERVAPLVTDRVSVFLLLGVCCIDSDCDPSVALTYLDAAMHLDPGRLDIRSARAEALGRAKRWNEAIAEARAVIAADSGARTASRDAWAVIGLIAARFRHEREYLEALRALELVDVGAARELEGVWNEGG